MAAKNIVYFDLETQKSAQEVGGWHNKALMRMSVGVTYSTARGSYMIYPENRAEELVRELQRADCVIGFNVIDFDYKVLSAYTIFDFSQVPTLDLLVDIEKKIGKRIKLDAVATETLGVGKTADGLEALKWWKEGRILEIAEYCCYDVKTTWKVHDYGAQWGKVFFTNSATHRRESIPTAEWKL